MKWRLLVVNRVGTEKKIIGLVELEEYNVHLKCMVCVWAIIMASMLTCACFSYPGCLIGEEDDDSFLMMWWSSS